VVDTVLRSDRSDWKITAADARRSFPWRGPPRCFFRSPPAPLLLPPYPREVGMALVACPRCNITPPQASACGIRCLLRAPRSAASRPPPWRLRRSRAMAVYEGWHSAAAGADTDGGAPAPHVPPSLLVFSGNRTSPG
jgi:hypothetical protein